MTTVTLYRPVGSAELTLIEASGFKAFPPRLPEQPIFYPVTNESYAAQIARGWNTKVDDKLGFVARLLNLLLGVGLLLWGAGVWGLAVASFVSMAVAVLLGYRLLLRYVRPVWRADWAYWRASMGQPTAVGIGIVFSIVSFRLDNLLIPPIVGTEALAVYNVAYKLFEPSLILPGVLLAAVFPMLSQAAHTPTSLRVVVRQTHVALFGLGLAATLALALFATVGRRAEG